MIEQPQTLKAKSDFAVSSIITIPKKVLKWDDLDRVCKDFHRSFRNSYETFDSFRSLVDRQVRRKNLSIEIWDSSKSPISQWEPFNFNFFEKTEVIGSSVGVINMKDMADFKIFLRFEEKKEDGRSLFLRLFVKVDNLGGGNFSKNSHTLECLEIGGASGLSEQQMAKVVKVLAPMTISSVLRRQLNFILI